MTTSDERPRPETGETNRRQFLGDAAGAAGVAAITYFWFEGFGDPTRRARIAPTAAGEPGRTFDARQMRTVWAACDRLLPSGGPSSPGARDVNAAGYLDAVLASGEVPSATRTVILDGLGKLDLRARHAGASDFASAPPETQDAAIRLFETYERNGQHPGHAWLKGMLRYVLEAFFGDPVHGGNPGGIAWTWAGVRPGFPRPTEPNWRPHERPA
jgi:hypothetical protein